MAQKTVATTHASAFGAYLRISQEGDRTPAQVTEQLDFYERACRSLAARKGVEVVVVVSETDVSGGKAVADRQLDALIKRVEDGELGGIIVPDAERFARDMIEGCLALKRIRDAGGRFLSDDGIDSDEPSSTEFFQMRMLFAESYLRKVAGRFAERVAASIGRGIHSGSVAPLGYDWPHTTIDLGDGRTKIKKLGPLEVIEPAASRVREAFAGFGAENIEERLSWHQVRTMLGTKSIGAARSLLMNRAYLGEARSGQNVRPDSHPALVSIEVFERVQRRLEDGKKDVTLTEPSPRKPRGLAKILRCSCCGGVLSPDDTTWRCKRPACENRGAGIQDTIALPYALRLAQTWHAEHHPLWSLGREVDRAVLPALEEAVRVARRALAEAEALVGVKLPADSTQGLAVEAAEKAIRDHEASFGWIGRTPEQVEEALASGDPETINSFLRDTLRIVVSKCGRHATREARAAEARCAPVYMSGGLTIDGAPDTVFEGDPRTLQFAALDSKPEPVVSAVERKAVEAALKRVQS